MLGHLRFRHFDRPHARVLLGLMLVATVVQVSSMANAGTGIDCSWFAKTLFG